MLKSTRTTLAIATIALLTTGTLLGVGLAEYAQSGAFSFYRQAQVAAWSPAPIQTEPAPDTVGYYALQPYAAGTQAPVSPVRWQTLDYPETYSPRPDVSVAATGMGVADDDAGLDPSPARADADALPSPGANTDPEAAVQDAHDASWAEPADAASVTALPAAQDGNAF